MREMITQCVKELETRVAAERGGAKYKEVRRPNEYIEAIGHDSSILQVVLNRDIEPYCSNVYTRVVWSERNPSGTPFAFKRYWALDFTEKPKQAFHDDKKFEFEFLTKEQVEKRLFGEWIPAAV